MTSTLSTSARPYDPLSISSLDFWAKSADEREQTFARLRAERPVSWHRPLEGAIMPPENDGVWVVVSHEHISEVSKHPELFCSGQGFQFEEIPEDVLSAAGSFLGMDDPRHAALRRLVSSAFTPKQVAKIHDQIKNQARLIVDGLIARKEGDFVEAAHHADGMVSWADEDVAAGREPGEVLNDSLVGLLTMGFEFAEERRRNPKSDLMTGLVNAEVDGEKLTDEEIASFFVLLSVAGNDTTRNSISITTKAFQDFPAQRELLLADFEGRIKPAIEEFVRWASPVMTFRRTATQDTVLGGQEIKAGEWVAMVYSSGNRDEKVFERPNEFDITRSPNPHVGFGGGGPHFCMGSFVAKMQLQEIFDQLLHRAPTLKVGEPEYLTGNFVRAVKSMPYTL
ncbi:cytochrome P450 [Gordonia bronchialis]|uniref:cytochrome P450 n=1 Tax=Gordonia bronchialis TaxID=2054 RepID=UPI001CBE5001|nr:cytochrome P450 [Gordonia bronchialis]UAK39432.1 cytochrome P450 [Gordonia bronchialis]